MQYSWPKVVELFRNFAQNRTKFLGKTPQETLGYAFYLREEMRHTDRFQPCNSDAELSRALEKMPKYCNYRSIKSYWAWKNGKEALADACYSILLEMEELITEWFNHPWNHPPGYVKPLSIEFAFDAEEDAVKLAREILKLVHQK